MKQVFVMNDRRNCRMDVILANSREAAWQHLRDSYGDEEYATACLDDHGITQDNLTEIDTTGATGIVAAYVE